MKTLKYSFILFAVVSVFGFINSGIAGDISININDEGTEIVGMGGTSNVNVTTGCVKGSGVKKTEIREVDSFRSIQIDGAFDMNVALQKKQNVEITSDDNILPSIVTDVKGDTLVIHSRESICPKSALEVNISAMDVEKIVSDGSNDIFISDMKNTRFALDLDGSSDVRASGKTGQFVVKLSGSGGVKAKDLHAEDVEVNISGSGDAVVYASGKLRAEIAGVGDITYFGNPKEISRNISGVGDIEKGD